MKFLNVYQYVAPLILGPLSYYLWLREFAGNHRFVLLMLSIPVIWAYIIPGLGTNWLGLWTFNTRLRLGKFRPHHGFVFGSATSLFALLTVAGPPPPFGPFELLRTGFLLGSVLALWNWLYDIYAIKAGFITVYNRPYALGQGPAAIATDYAPLLFGTFGLCYGIVIRLGQHYLLELARWDYYGYIFIGGNLAGLIGPVAAFMLMAYLRYGDFGLTRMVSDK